MCVVFVSLYTRDRAANSLIKIRILKEPVWLGDSIINVLGKLNHYIKLNISCNELLAIP